MELMNGSKKANYTFNKVQFSRAPQLQAKLQSSAKVFFYTLTFYYREVSLLTQIA